MFWEAVYSNPYPKRRFYGGDSVFETPEFGAPVAPSVPELSWQAIFPDMNFILPFQRSISKFGEEFASPMIPTTTPSSALIVHPKGLALSWRVD